MLLRLALFSCLLTSTVLPLDRPACLTGYMTDIQTWVDEHGDLTAQVEPDEAIDLSKKFLVDRMLREHLQYYISLENSAKYLSLAKCQLGRVPKIFHYKCKTGSYLFEILEYLTLYGNSFTDTSSTGLQYQMTINATDMTEIDALRQFQDGRNIWATGFEGITFTALKELDLRACSIETIGSSVFTGMPKLEALYIGENNIYRINSAAFDHLINLVHLDISRNTVYRDMDLTRKPLLMRDDIFRNMKNLRSIDMSYTEFHPKTKHSFSKLGPKVQRLSLCWTMISNLTAGHFNSTSLKYLDVSGNVDVFINKRSLQGLENSLEIIYATHTKLKDFDIFNNFKKLKILKLVNNELSSIKETAAMSLTNLQVLDLERNRFGSWFLPIFEGMRSLRLLSLARNNINVLTIQMMNDIKDITYIGVSGNPIVCNCHTRELIDTAIINEMTQAKKFITLDSSVKGDKSFATYSFNTALVEYNEIITNRKNISHLCSKEGACRENEVSKYTGKFLLFDYLVEGSYSCLLATESRTIPFVEVTDCNAKSGYYDVKDELNKGMHLLILLALPGTLLPIMLLIYLFRKRIRYFYITMKNSATLSLISPDDVMGEDKIYNYDVFVSYCHEDRAWLLDQLLPHLETDCSVSVCLHERDFQVGLSILENIVSCMDRSRTIMLIISKQFLKSQWCQFEMHLAQHRLLETRREDLTLILLEEIPRRLRPNTLHYLMLTKTYIVWPKEESEQAIFWRRLKKSVVTQKNKLHDNVTLA